MNFFNNIFNQSKEDIIGLDVGTSYIKCIAISVNENKKITVNDYSIEPIPRELLSEDDKFENLEEIAKIIKKCVGKLHVKSNKVALAMQNYATIYKKITIPAQISELEIMEQIKSEIAQLLPSGTGAQDMVIDYFCIEKTKETEELYITAAKKDSVQDLVDLVGAAGLIPLILEPEHITLQNMLLYLYGDKFKTDTYLVLDLSAYKTVLLGFKKGQIFYTKSKQVGGFNLTQEISSYCILDIQKAEKIKINHSTAEQGGHNEKYTEIGFIEELFVGNLVEPIGELIAYFVSATSITEINQVILIGGSSGIKGLGAEVKKTILNNSDLSIKNGVLNFTISDFTEQTNEVLNNANFKRDQFSLSLSMGLALRGNFRNY